MLTSPNPAGPVFRILLIAPFGSAVKWSILCRLGRTRTCGTLLGKRQPFQLIPGPPRRMIVGAGARGRIHRGARNLAGELNLVDEGLSAPTHWSDVDSFLPVLDAADRGDPDAVGQLDEFAARAARQIAYLALTIDPELIVLGGPLADRAALTDRIAAGLQRLLARARPGASGHHPVPDDRRGPGRAATGPVPLLRGTPGRPGLPGTDRCPIGAPGPAGTAPDPTERADLTPTGALPSPHPSMYREDAPPCAQFAEPL
ncbi:ROK family protein [Actinomadura oligospora]|uniref:ROK family protein n=1 Tax=Actinomadura oligospora TaxID=111804 RepID=UPI0012F7E95A